MGSDSRYDFVDIFSRNISSISYDNRAVPTGSEFRIYLDKFIGTGGFPKNNQKSLSLNFYNSRFYEKKIEENKKIYAVIPSFENPRWLVLNKRVVINNSGFIIKPTSRKARFAWFVARQLAKVNMLGLIFPCRMSLEVAYASDSDKLSELIDSCTILYTGSQGIFQKFTMMCGKMKENRHTYCKLSSTPNGVSRIRGEQKALGLLQNKVLPGVLVPKCISEIEFGKFFGINSSDILSGTRMSLDFNAHDINFVTAMCREFSLDKKSLKDYFGSDVYKKYALIKNACADLEKEFRYSQITLTKSHGDYIPWNRFLGRNSISIIDWETMAHRPAFYDLCYFVIHKTLLIDQGSSSLALERTFQLLKENKVAFERSIGIESPDFSLHIEICILEILLHYLSNESGTDKDFIANVFEIYEESKLFRTHII